MYKSKTFLAIIPARGGSKGIPRKNIFKVNGKPLIEYTIDEALKSQYLDEIIVSTEDVEIAEIAKNCGAHVPFLRPMEFAKDDSKTIDAILHVIEKLKIKKQVYDYIVLLQPTQPLRQAFHIDEAIELMILNNYNSIVSVSDVKEHPILMRKINEDGVLDNLLNISSSVRRQDFSRFYKINGAIYINQIDAKLNISTSFNDNRFPYIMDTKYDVDIDEFIDIELFKLKLKGISENI